MLSLAFDISFFETLSLLFVCSVVGDRDLELTIDFPETLQLTTLEMAKRTCNPKMGARLRLNAATTEDMENLSASMTAKVVRLHVPMMGKVDMTNPSKMCPDSTKQPTASQPRPMNGIKVTVHPKSETTSLPYKSDEYDPDTKIAPFISHPHITEIKHEPQFLSTSSIAKFILLVGSNLRKHAYKHFLQEHPQLRIRYHWFMKMIFAVSAKDREEMLPKPFDFLDVIRTALVAAVIMFDKERLVFGTLELWEENGWKTEDMELVHELSEDFVSQILEQDNHPNGPADSLLEASGFKDKGVSKTARFTDGHVSPPPENAGYERDAENWYFDPASIPTPIRRFHERLDATELLITKILKARGVKES